MTFLHNMTLITIQAILGSNSLAQRQSKQQIIYDFLQKKATKAKS